MISKVQIENFKGFKNIELDLSKLNLFVGENGTGKSTVAQALSIFKKSAKTSGINTDLPSLNLGPLDKLIPPSESATIILSGDMDVNLKKPFVNGPVKFSAKIQFDFNGLLLYESEIKFQQYTIHGYRPRSGILKVDPDKLTFFGITFYITPPNYIGEVFGSGGYSYPGTDPLVAQKILSEILKLGDLVFKKLEKIIVVPEIRGILEPSYNLLPTVSPELNSRVGMYQVGSSFASDLAYLDKIPTDNIKKWMKTLMNVNIEWKLMPGNQIAILSEGDERESYLVNEGFGTNQIVFILYPIAYAKKDSLIIVEEPEIHLHPEAQFSFGKFLSKIVADEGIQFILNTHSEHILYGVLDSIRSGIIGPDDVAIWLFEKQAKENTAKKCKINSNGTTDEGLKTFIKTSIKEMDEMLIK
jgi:hypothetical protein